MCPVLQNKYPDLGRLQNVMGSELGYLWLLKQTLQ